MSRTAQDYNAATARQLDPEILAALPRLWECHKEDPTFAVVLWRCEYPSFTEDIYWWARSVRTEAQFNHLTLTTTQGA